MSDDNFVREIQQKIESGADLNAKGEGGIALLHSWTTAGRSDIVGLLLSSGADPNIREDSGWTPLHFAAAGGNLALVQLLLAKGADQNARDYTGGTLAKLMGTLFHKGLGKTPLHYAESNGHHEVSAFLRDSPQPSRSTK